MMENTWHKENTTLNPPRFPQLLPLLQKAKEAYLLWYNFYLIIPKTHRYSLGQKIDIFFTEIIEAIAAASFTTGEDKIKFIRLAIKKADVLKIFLMILWETKYLDNKRYLTLSIKIDEIGKMLNGWHGQQQKQNSLIK